MWGTSGVACWVVLFVFLCLHVFTAQCGWWVWVRVWVGHKSSFCGQAHCRVHVQHRVSVCRPCGWWLPAQPAWRGFLLGVGCVWWVVCDLYSGCEHLLFSCCVVLFSFVGHSVDALASRADEGRCGLRYASGSWRASFDPRVSEWGNLTRVVLGYHHLNVYRVVGGTRGSETS